MKKLITAIFLVAVSSVYGQNGCFGEFQKELPFAVGEHFKYSVDYSSAMLSTGVADVDFYVSLDNYVSVPVYKIEAIGKTRPFFNLFFEIDDNYTTLLDTVTLRPLIATSRLKEGGFQYRNEFTFNWKNRTVNTMGHNIKKNNRGYKTMPLLNCSYDAVALFYNMRRIKTDNLLPNQKFNLNLVLEDTVRTIQARFHGREVKKIEGLGNFKTLKFSCKFATSNDDTFKDGAEFFVWISDDQNKIPIYLESPIRVGKIVVKLSRWEGLQHSFSSIIPK